MSGRLKNEKKRVFSVFLVKTDVMNTLLKTILNRKKHHFYYVIDIAKSLSDSNFETNEHKSVACCDYNMSHKFEFYDLDYSS